jgi:hypothetical protein
MLWHLTASNQFLSASMDSGEQQTFWPEIGNNTAKEIHPVRGAFDDDRT